jgi:hypothetical protein
VHRACRQVVVLAHRCSSPDQLPEM